MASVTALTLSAELHRQVLSHARTSLPREAVGLLGGKATGQVAMVLPLMNIAAQDRAFIADSFTQFCAFWLRSIIPIQAAAFTPRRRIWRTPDDGLAST